MGLIKNIQLLDADTTATELREALMSDPQFFPGKVADELDPDNEIRKIRKYKNIDFLMEHPLEDVVAAYNKVALQRTFKIKEAKQLLPFFSFGFSFLKSKANESGKKVINAIEIFVKNLI
jgi:hypothetical protein